MVSFAGSITGGATLGTASGTLVAFGAYSAAQALATASTGTAIKALMGIAAKNATLAFFGGGLLAVGGIGIAGGMMVLGGLTAGPALIVMGPIIDCAAGKNNEQARTNHVEALRLSSELDTHACRCEAIHRKTYMFYNLLARLDAAFYR